MSSDPFDDKQNLPPWLRDVPLPPRPHDPNQQPAPGQLSAPSPAADLPDWLSEISAEAAPATPHASPPDQQRSNTAPPAPARAGDQSALPDWLRDSQAEQSTPPAGSEQLPSWLQDSASANSSEGAGASAAPASQPSEVTIPDWLREDEPNAAAPPEQIPSWLRDMGADTPDQGATNTEAEESQSWLPSQPVGPSSFESASSPDWLREQKPEDQASPAPAFDDPFAGLDQPNQAAAPGDNAQPDWLNATSETPVPAGVSPVQPLEQPPASANDSGVPDWLRNIAPFSDEDDQDDIVIEPFSFEGATGTSAPSEPASLPSWLGSANDADDTSAAMPDWFRETTDPADNSGASTPARPSAPDWLTGASNQAESQPAATPGSPDVPLWLQDSQQEGAAAGPAPSDPAKQITPAQPPDESVPSWLQDTAAPAQPPDESVPSWLQDTAAPAQPAPENVPSWLQDAATPAQPPAEKAPEHEVAPTPPAPAPEIPAWLQDHQTNVPTEPAAPSSAPAEPGAEHDALPEWLRPTGETPAPASNAGAEIPPWLRDEAGQPLPTAGAPGDTNLPAWLHGATLDRAPAAETNQPPAQPAAQSESTGFDWFTDETAPPLADPSASNADNELVGGIELPAWLRPVEPEPPKELNPTDARSLDWLTRLGGQEEEENISEVAAAPLRLRPPAGPARTAAQTEAIALLQRLAAEPYPEAAPAPTAEHPGLWRRLGGERLLYLVLLIALVAALALPGASLLGLNTPPAAPGAPELFAQIDRLSENDIVLVGYEWDARRSGELRPLEQAVLDHLIQHRVKLVLVSTDAQGTLLLFDLRDKLEAAGYKPSGEDYIMLGYKPGAELALRSLAQDFRGALRSDFQGNDATLSGLATNPGGQPRLNSLGDFGMVLVLADEPVDVQGWMEQVHPSAKRADATFVPFGFLLPAETAPIVQPYLNQANVYHLSGTSGALAYQQLRGGQGLPAEQIASAAGEQRLSLLIYVALFLIGAVAVGVNSAVARGRKRL